MLYTSPWSRSELTASVVIDTDCIGSCKSNYHTITATTAHALQRTKAQTTTPDTLLLNSCYLKLSRVSIVTFFIHKTLIYIPSYSPLKGMGRRGCYGMVVGFTTTYAISVYHHWCCEFRSRPGRGVQHYVIKFVSDLWQVGGFLRVLRVTCIDRDSFHT
jgi:hypothetical protein